MWRALWQPLLQWHLPPLHLTAQLASHLPQSFLLWFDFQNLPASSHPSSITHFPMPLSDFPKTDFAARAMAWTVVCVTVFYKRGGLYKILSTFLQNLNQKIIMEVWHPRSPHKELKRGGIDCSQQDWPSTKGTVSAWLQKSLTGSDVNLWPFCLGGFQGLEIQISTWICQIFHNGVMAILSCQVDFI